MKLISTVKKKQSLVEGNISPLIALNTNIVFITITKTILVLSIYYNLSKDKTQKKNKIQSIINCFVTLKKQSGLL